MALNRYYARSCDVCRAEVGELAGSATEAMKVARRFKLKRYVYKLRAREAYRFNGMWGERRTVHEPIRGDICSKCQTRYPPIDDVPVPTPWVREDEKAEVQS